MARRSFKITRTKILWSAIISYALTFSLLFNYSERCINGRAIVTYLTTGIGSSDASVGIIANEKTLNCSLVYFVRPMNYVMLVLEFPDWQPKEKICQNERNSIHAVSDVISENVCLHLDRSSKSIYSMPGKSNVRLNISSAGNMSTIKVTATSMRDPFNTSCLLRKETECFHEEKLYCMNSESLCDGNNNCGLRGLFDEDNRQCEGSKLTPEKIIYAIITSGILFWMVISVSITLAPKRKETFVYKMNQSMSLFDSNEDQIAFEIDVKVVYPRDHESNISLQQNRRDTA